MARRPKKLPKQRNFYAAAVLDPSSPFRPKTIPTKMERLAARKRKHKGKNANHE
jgi:hypothetical protein